MGSSADERNARYEDREIGPVTVLFGDEGGKYPDGNSLLVRGSRESALIDPSLGVVARRELGRLPDVDRVLNSHCHEDHIVGNHLFPEVPWHVHEADAVGFRSVEDFLTIYGFPEHIEGPWRQNVLTKFHYTPRPDIASFADGDVFDLGGVTIRVVHTPGHTRGHSLLVVEWGDRTTAERLVYLGDIELTSFGPYYGDAWSNLADFERSLTKVRTIEAAWWATFHHIGVLEPARFAERLDRFESKILERESALLEYLEEPHTLDEIVSHRFVYRPGPAAPFVDSVERRSMSMHLERLIAQDRVEELSPERYQTVEPYPTLANAQRSQARSGTLAA
jgi:glyoxylase-like metal-dependent hydrolase (beta-lactamase superfamily II)